MLKPSLRLFILPLGAVSAIATMASQDASQAGRNGMMREIRQEIVVCAPNLKTDVCIVSEKVGR
jgi:hypothetical protein